MIELKLSANRAQDVADVVALISANQLTVRDVDDLDPSVREQFVALVAQAEHERRNQLRE